MSDRLVGTTGNLIDRRGVDHPVHYNNHPSGVEIIEVNRYMTANVAAAFKYVMRRGDKVDPALGIQASVLKDLDKAIWYLQDELQHRPAKVSEYPEHVTTRMMKIIKHEQTFVVKAFIAYTLGYMQNGYPASLTGMIAKVRELRRVYE